jgi:hypothetical protein
MSHRVKNLLALASGLRAITARGTETKEDMVRELQDVPVSPYRAWGWGRSQRPALLLLFTKSRQTQKKRGTVCRARLARRLRRDRGRRGGNRLDRTRGASGRRAAVLGGIWQQARPKTGRCPAWWLDLRLGGSRTGGQTANERGPALRVTQLPRGSRSAGKARFVPDRQGGAIHR